MTWRGLGSDNHSGVHPLVLAAIAAANDGHAHPYGDDPWTAAAHATLRRHLGAECDIAFVWNGTGANCVSFAASCSPWESVVCAETAHINCDECGAPERVGGVKLVPVATPDGKLNVDLVSPHLKGFGFEHATQPHVISVSNVSEFGTVYAPDEVRPLAEFAHSHGMLLHVDGARIANACVATGATLAEMITQSGVDLLSLGGTKNGMLAGEAVVLLGGARTEELKYVRKQLTQLSSKQRFIAAQFSAMFDGDLWLECARHANAMAARLAAGAREKGIELAQEPQANEVFAVLPREAIAPLIERFHFYVWDEPRSIVRWVTSWDTTSEDVDALVEALPG
jgi:threonine aldolase